jgi:GT2 family glycosyltransferase
LGVQVQAVIYNNEPWTVHRALTSIANAARVCREQRGQFERFNVALGDASPQPVPADDVVEEWRNEFARDFDLSVSRFGFNSGSARGHNLLAKDATADFLVLLNPDVILTPNFFMDVMRPFNELGDEAGIAEARQSPIEHSKDYDVETGETSWATGACTVIPRAVFEAVGGYDADTFFMYCDDVDLSWRVRLTGRKVIFLPDVPVFHAKRLSPTGAWQPTSAERYYSAEAALLMAYKWSQPAILKRILTRFTLEPNDVQHRAADAFKQRRKDGRLPVQLDPEHTVAQFIEGNYGPLRYVM